MENNKLTYTESWHGEHRGISFLVKCHRGLEHPTWCYYIQLSLKQLPSEYRKYFVLRAKRLGDHRHYYGYFSKPIISDLDWHGGITWYEKQYDNGKLIGKVPLLWQSNWDNTYHGTEGAALDYGNRKSAEYKTSSAKTKGGDTGQDTTTSQIPPTDKGGEC